MINIKYQSTSRILKCYDTNNKLLYYEAIKSNNLYLYALHKLQIT